jgi:hypothetical protein
VHLKSFLKQPFPFPERIIPTALTIGVGISLLMVLLQPFGLSGALVGHFGLFLAGYGLVSCLTLLFNNLLVLKLFSDLHWNVIRQIGWTCWSVFCLGLANYAYTYTFIRGFPFSISALLLLQIYTFFIGLVPITILVLLRQNRLLRVHKSAAEVLNDNLEVVPASEDFTAAVVLTAENGKTQLNLQVDDLAFIEAEGNYIQIHMRKSDTMLVTTIRSSISRAGVELASYPQMIKCHRAFIVNKDFIEGIKGNAQGYRLRIKGSDREVYVSRQYTKLIKACFSSQNRAFHP